MATQTALERAGRLAPPGSFAIPSMLNCLVLSWSEQRAQLLQSVAVDEAWQAKVCGDVQEFLRSVFQLDVPLTVVDLPRKGTASYAELREIATQTHGVNRSLLVVCGASTGGDPDEEQWARELGAWAYLPGATDASGLRLVFAEARKALAKQSTAYVEANGYR
ncbi:MAG: hypothetical protein ACR2NM_00800 [Bythopirellula sp.]